MIPVPILKSGEARIHYALEGQSGAPLLLFSNSLGANHSMWDPQAREFYKKFRVLRMTRGVMVNRRPRPAPIPSSNSRKMLSHCSMNWIWIAFIFAGYPWAE